MLSRGQVLEVEAALATGLSRRAAAAATGVSRGSVARIAQEKHPYCSARYRGEDTSADETPTTRGKRRCPDCGSLVDPPCLACRIRRMLRTAGGSPRAAGDDAENGDEITIELELRGSARGRYDKLKLQKVANGVIEVSLAESDAEPSDEELAAIEDAAESQDGWSEPVVTG